MGEVNLNTFTIVHRVRRFSQPWTVVLSPHLKFLVTKKIWYFQFIQYTCTIQKILWVIWYLNIKFYIMYMTSYTFNFISYLFFIFYTHPKKHITKHKKIPYIVPIVIMFKNQYWNITVHRKLRVEYNFMSCIYIRKINIPTGQKYGAFVF